MTDRIAEAFERQKKQGKKALITFITAGDPDLETTERLVLAMEKSGANLIELGIPFSDPVAEGPVIQQADLRALKNGICTDDVFDAVAKIREKTQIPLVFMVYVNCIFVYGKERFFKRCSESGVDGVIIPDLPYEEKGEVHGEAAKFGIKVISLVAPTSRERIEMIAKDAEGFLYCVSSEGVTGIRESFSTDFDSYFETINRYAKVPTALGFGISKPEAAKALQKYTDGIIIGSAIMKLVGEAANADSAVESVSEFVGNVRKAMDE
jgi:tryptophan synthase, alpha chain (EC 4.2.1.20)